MKTVSGRKFCQVLERHAWELDHIKGSHHVYKRTGNPLSLAVPVHGNHDLSPGTQRKLMGQAELTDADL